MSQLLDATRSVVSFRLHSENKKQTKTFKFKIIYNSRQSHRLNQRQNNDLKLVAPYVARRASSEVRIELQNKATHAIISVATPLWKTKPSLMIITYGCSALRAKTAAPQPHPRSNVTG
jgi:hypothetical protein